MGWLLPWLGPPQAQVETFLNGPLLVEVHSFGGSKLQFRLREEASFMELYHSTEARNSSRSPGRDRDLLTKDHQQVTCVNSIRTVS